MYGKMLLFSQIAANGTSYYLKDVEARTKLDALSSVTCFIGKITNEITDGTTTSPIVIGGQSVIGRTEDMITVS